MKLPIILDTETVGFENHPVHGHPQVIQLAYVILSGDLQADLQFFLNLDTADTNIINEVNKQFENFNRYYKPSMPINPHASAVNGIYLTDLEGCPASETVLDDFTPTDYSYIIGHNISFDQRCLNIPKDADVRYICTKALAARVAAMKPMPKSTSLKPLIEHLFPRTHQNLSDNSHTAHFDVIKTGLLLSQLMLNYPGLLTYDDLWQFMQMKVPTKGKVTYDN